MTKIISKKGRKSNKRKTAVIDTEKLDDIILDAYFHSEDECGYTDEYLTMDEYEQGVKLSDKVIKKRIRQVDGWTKLKLGGMLVIYLSSKYQYDDVEIITANIEYVNKVITTNNDLCGWRNFDVQSIMKDLKERYNSRKKCKSVM